MTEEPRLYLSYLLRIWQANNNGKLIWRCSLEDPHTGECHHFVDMEKMVLFLRAFMANPDQPSFEPGRNHV